MNEHNRFDLPGDKKEYFTKSGTLLAEALAPG